MNGRPALEEQKRTFRLHKYHAKPCGLQPWQSLFQARLNFSDVCEETTNAVFGI